MLSDRCPVLSVLTVCDLGVLWPNGWMDKDATWYGGGPRPRRQCIRWGSSPPPKGAPQPPIFLPMSIVAKRLGGSGYHLVRRSRPRRRCVGRGPSSIPHRKGHSSPPPLRPTVLWHGRPSQLLLNTCLVRLSCSFYMFLLHDSRRGAYHPSSGLDLVGAWIKH